MFGVGPAAPVLAVDQHGNGELHGGFAEAGDRLRLALGADRAIQAIVHLQQRAAVPFTPYGSHP